MIYKTVYICKLPCSNHFQKIINLDLLLNLYCRSMLVFIFTIRKYIATASVVRIEIVLKNVLADH